MLNKKQSKSQGQGISNVERNSRFTNIQMSTVTEEKSSRDRISSQEYSIFQNKSDLKRKSKSEQSSANGIKSQYASLKRAKINIPGKRAKDVAQRRFAPGQRALQEIKRAQSDHRLLIRKLPFQKFVRNIAQKLIVQNNKKQPRFTLPALDLLQLLVEEYMVGLLEDSKLCSIHGKRMTLQRRDIILARRIRGFQDTGFEEFASILIKK